MSAHRTGKSYKGCCLMCGHHTIRGVGYAQRLPHRDMRKLGRKRVKRARRRDAWDD